MVVDLKHPEVHHTMLSPQGDIPRLGRGELTFLEIAAALGLSVCELYDLFEQKGLLISV
jgi:hypothetical protein